MTIAYILPTRQTAASAWNLLASFGAHRPQSTPAVSLEGSEQAARYFVLLSQERVRQVGKLKQNWDGANSSRPNAESVANASARLPEIYRVVGGVGSWEAPHVSASEEGEITFEWWRKDRKLTLYFSAVRMEVIKVWGEDIHDEMDAVSLNAVTDFAEVWSWFNDGR